MCAVVSLSEDAVSGSCMDFVISVGMSESDVVAVPVFGENSEVEFFSTCVEFDLNVNASATPITIIIHTLPMRIVYCITREDDVEVSGLNAARETSGDPVFCEGVGALIRDAGIGF